MADDGTAAPRPLGSGPGVVTDDGCAVELYARLPATGEPELVHTSAPGASVLDLGAGTGRVADPLSRLGHRVVAVDDSADMLARVTTAHPVLSRIEDLDLAERFGVVLLASHLLNTDDDEQRHAFLRTAARHLAADGLALVQWHPPEWFARLEPGGRYRSSRDGLSTTLDVLALDATQLTGALTYELDELTWTQRFGSRRLSDDDLTRELAGAGLAFDGFADDDRLWVRARPATPTQPKI